MPEWVSDNTRRFVLRPKYSAEEIETRCENAIYPILLKRHGKISHPITDDDLTVLLESLGVELELQADFPDQADWVQGMTEFLPGRPPRVLIAKELMESPKLARRYRFTLGHETGHVLALTEAYERPGNVLDGQRLMRHSCNTKRPASDIHNWPEWQADQTGGALLMPREPLKEVLAAKGEMELSRPHPPGSPAGLTMIGRTAEWFEVSSEAAQVRLTRLGICCSPFDHDNLSYHFPQLYRSDRKGNSIVRSKFWWNFDLGGSRVGSERKRNYLMRHPKID